MSLFAEFANYSAFSLHKTPFHILHKLGSVFASQTVKPGGRVRYVPTLVVTSKLSRRLLACLFGTNTSWGLHSPYQAQASHDKRDALKCSVLQRCTLHCTPEQCRVLHTALHSCVAPVWCGSWCASTAWPAGPGSWSVPPARRAAPGHCAGAWGQERPLVSRPRRRSRSTQGPTTNRRERPRAITSN